MFSSTSQPYSKEDATLFPTDDPALVSFDYGAPGPSLLPTALISEAARHRCSRADSDNTLQYGPVLGDKEFRVELAHFLTKEYGDVPVNYNNLAVTSGASQSFFNIITLFTSPDTIFLIEDPTYFLAIRMLADHGIARERLHTIPTDEQGIIVDSVAEILANLASIGSRSASSTGRFPFFLYLVPTYSNPTGSTLPDERRKRLLELAREYNVLILCDDVYQLLHYDTSTRPPKRLVAYDDMNGNGNIISNCSFSKIFAPGLRLGWIEAPKGVIKRLEGCGLLYSGGSPNHLTTGLITSLFQLSLFSRHLADLRKTYASRLNAVVTALQANLPPSAHFIPPKGGYFIWLILPQHIDTRHLRKALRDPDAETTTMFPGLQREMVSFKPGAEFTLSGAGCKNALRLSFAYYAEDILTEGCRRLCRVLKSIL